MLVEYGQKFPEEKAELDRRLSGELPNGWREALEKIEFPKNGTVATRVASGTILNAMAPVIPELVGGSADLGPSNKTSLKDFDSFLPNCPSGRNIHFGVREGAMGAILNGLSLSGALIPYGGTFLVFSDFCRPAIRLSALMKLKVIYVLTHDSLGVGEDGPTHQPIEHLMALRLIPNLMVLRPADGYETKACWTLALSRKGPSAIILSRQNLGTLHPETFPQVLDGPLKGGYILVEAEGGEPDALIIASGSEVGLALSAREKLMGQKRVRVVSLPSMELFEEQSLEYRNKVLPPNLKKRLGIEAGRSIGWERYIGESGRMISVDSFGHSAPAEKIFSELGFTAENVVKTLLTLF
jgi:transketolase